VVDRLGVSGDSRNKDVWGEVRARATKVRVCWQLDVAGWKKALLEALF